MKRIVLLILGLLLLFDLAEDGCLGQAKFLPPQSAAETSVTSSHHLDAKHIGFPHNLADADWPGSPRHGEAPPIILDAPLTLQIIHCRHISSAGGIPW